MYLCSKRNFWLDSYAKLVKKENKKIIWSLPFQCYAYNRAYTYYIPSPKYSTRCAAFFVDKPVFSLPKCHWQIENVFFTSDIYGCHLMRFSNTNLKIFFGENLTKWGLFFTPTRYATELFTVGLDLLCKLQK